MAPILIPVALAIGTGAIGVGLGVTTVAAAALSVGVTAVAAGVSYLMRPSVGGMPTAGSSGGASVAEPVAAPANSQRNIPISQPIPPRRFVFGECRTGGVLFLEDNNNPYLFIGSAISDGEIESFEAVYLGEEEVPLDAGSAPDYTWTASYGSRFYNNFSVDFALGTATQGVSPLASGSGIPGIYSTSKQLGVARAVARLNWGADAAENNTLWGDGTAPAYRVKGVKVYDPRDGTQTLGTPSSYKYSDNPALCVAHALTNAWGVALQTSAIDWESVETAADDCDATLSGYGPLFRCAGIFQANVDLGSQIGDMLSAFRGRITFSDGKYGIVADKARSSVWTVADADILEIGEFANATPAAGLFNAISAVFYDAASGGTRTTTKPFEISAAVLAEGLRETNVTLPFTPDSYSAQVLAYRELQTLRDGRALSIRLTDAALYLAPGEVITISSTEAAFLNGAYTVEQVDASDVGAVLTLKGYASTAYTDPLTYVV